VANTRSIRPAGAQELVQTVGRLPALPGVVSRLMEISSDQNASAADLSQVVSLDAGLLTSILKLANSAYYGCSRTVSDLEAAIMLLGFDQVRDLALSLNVIAAIEPPGVSAFSTRDYWKHAFMAGSLARGFCRPLWRVYPGEHYVAGFLHDIGRLVLYLADPSAMREVVAGVNAGRDALAEERRVYGCDHAEVGGLACRHWRLPDRITAAVAAHHGAGLAREPSLAEQELVQMVHVADLLANRAGLGFTARRPRHRLAPAIRLALVRRGVWLRRSRLAPLVARTAAEVEATAQILAVGQPAVSEGG
jgi:HD-like signal output (HDOD) protein